jgi:ribosomal protein S14
VLETTEPAQGHIKRPSTSCAESGQLGAGRSQRDNDIATVATATSSYVPVVEDCARDEKDSKPSAVTSSVPLIGSSREVVREKATRGEIPSCWKVCFPI